MKFSLKCRDHPHDTAQTNRWISSALERGVSDLDLRVKTTWVCEPPRPLPCTVFTSKTLVKLTLGTELCAGDRSPQVFLPLLKYLFLDTVFVLENDFHEYMLRGCPALEEFVFNYVSINHDDAPPEPNSISHKTIRRITVRTNVPLTIFETPSLVYLDYSEKTRCLYNSARAEPFNSLVEARLDLAGLITGGRESDLLCELSRVVTCWTINVRILYFSSDTVQVMYSLGNWDDSHCCKFPKFRNLVKLSFETRTKRGWKVLPRMLKRSPKLETLVLMGLHCINKRGVCVRNDVVKVVQIYGYRGTGKELRQLERFLCQMDSLQLMKVEFDTGIEDAGTKLQVTEDLLALLPKCHSDCQIQFL